MARIHLTVPFADKDEAKRLGARWDPQERVWFVPDGIASARFSQWMPAWDVRSNRYWVVSGETYCWKCDQPTEVYALAVPPGHETLSDDDGDGDDEEWVRQDALQFLMYVSDMDNGVLAELQQRCPGWTRDYSKTTESHYWMNHCQHCRMKQGDFPLHSEPGGAFFPTDEAELKRLTFHRVHRPLHACAGTSMSTFLLDYEGWTAN